jgi:hypothetical protein
MHLDFSRPRVAHHHRASILSIVCSSSHLTNAVWIVLVVIEFAVCEELACEDQVGEFVATARRLGVVAFCAVEVAVKDAGVAVAVQQN